LTQTHIAVRGARENNLKNISLDIPREKLVVITGLSGAGKLSLTFDTICAEVQRRYVTERHRALPKRTAAVGQCGVIIPQKSTCCETNPIELMGGVRWLASVGMHCNRRLGLASPRSLSRLGRVHAAFVEAVGAKSQANRVRNAHAGL
jgi:ABC-type Mn2+/Zn2+ transport system ATPase subunit